MTGYNNRKMGRVVKLALALLVLFGTSQSYATCSQGNLKGTWYLNGITADTSDGIFWETDFCKIKVNSKGTIVKSGSSCKFRDAEGKGNLGVKGGNFALNSSCAITGKIKYCVDDFCANFKIDAGRLDKGKTVLTLVGRIDLDPDTVSYFTGIKK